ncbi:ABC transporter ATP-binding protein [Candidatus Woesearchaeota archaeon]|nr:ABC transporter ATP-binding protein [Candidatus Woesearchaeota archaeon]
MQQALIELKNVEKKYEYGKEILPVFKGINLRIMQGECISILGPNGCGKTTLLNLMGGFAKPTQGSLVFEHEEILNPDSRKILLFQELGLFDWKTVQQNIAFPLIFQGLTDQEKQQRIEDAIHLVNLQGFEKLYPSQLSGGMKQRTAIARAVVNNPLLLLLDEPFSALDQQTREFLQEELHEIQRQQNKTIVLVTHDIEEALYLSDRIIVLSARPSRIKKIFPIPFSKPRDPALRHTPAFSQLKKEIWCCLREEMKR